VSVVEYRRGIPLSAEVGERAPAFTLPTSDWNEKVSLDDLISDGPVVLIFYPGDWSSVCTGQLTQLQEEISRLRDQGASVAAISADTPWSHRAWAAARGIGFPLLSDLERSAVDDHGVRHERGHPERAYVVIDGEGIVRAKKIEESTGDQPEPDEVLSDLEKAL
jgi:peroxiredoxin